MKKSPLKKKKGDWNLTRSDILSRARKECLIEMYAKSQPAYDLESFFKECEKHKNEPNWHHPDDNEKEPLYSKHYLSEEEYKHILNRYIKAYGLGETWKNNVNLLLEYLKSGVHHDIYVKSEDGYNDRREVETLPTLEEQIGKENAEKVEYLITECRDWFRFDREESDFKCQIALGGSPSSNAEAVKEYWRKQGVELEIEERNAELFWYYDEGYTDKEIKEEFEFLERESEIDFKLIE